MHEAIYELAVFFHAMSQGIVHGKIQVPSEGGDEVGIEVVKESVGGGLREDALAGATELGSHASKKRLNKELLSTQADFVRVLNSGVFSRRSCRSPMKPTASPSKFYSNTSEAASDSADRYTTCKPFKPIELQPMISMDTSTIKENEIKSESNKGDYIKISVEPVTTLYNNPTMDIKIRKEHPQASPTSEDANREVKRNEPELELSYTESGITRISH